MRMLILLPCVSAVACSGSCDFQRQFDESVIRPASLLQVGVTGKSVDSTNKKVSTAGDHSVPEEEKPSDSEADADCTKKVQECTVGENEKFWNEEKEFSENRSEKCKQQKQIIRCLFNYPLVFWSFGFADDSCVESQMAVYKDECCSSTSDSNSFLGFCSGGVFEDFSGISVPRFNSLR